MRNYKLQSIPVSIICAILVALTLIANTSTPENPVFQSGLPRPVNPGFVAAATGGRIYCGAQQAPVWLEIPLGFIAEGGAEIHCDRAGFSSVFPNLNNAWDDRVYLVGIYTSQLLKPIDVVFAIDQARLSSVCAACWSAAYYDAANKRWQKLPTRFDVNAARVYATVTKILPGSQYPGYADRLAIALFTQTQQTPPTATNVSKPTSTAAIIVSTLASVQAPSTVTPVLALVHTQTPPAATPVSMLANTQTPSVVTPSYQVPTSAPTILVSAPAPTVSPVPNQPGPSVVNLDNSTQIIGWVAAGVLGIILVIIVVRRRNRT